jgi:alpha-L-rhamnosidase
MPKSYCLPLALAAAMLAAAQPVASPEVPQNLRCEYLTNPEAVDAIPPRLSWQPVSPTRGAVQSAYAILVSRDAAAATGDVWDSGRVAAAQFVNVPYAGKPLESGKTYYWKVRTWDNAGHESGWSAVARFGIGLLDKSDWKGQWIAGSNALRKEFSVSGKVVSAKIYVAAAGYYELRINGHKVGNHVLDPSYTPFAKRILYNAYDVTRAVNSGGNAIGLLLGEGWFGDRVALVQLNIELDGGQKIEVVSDASWQAGRSPITADSIYNGESYDARLEQPGWDQAGFTGEGWKAAAVKPAPTQTLSAQAMPPIRALMEMTPKRMSSPKPGMFVYDLGQNFSGWVRLRASGPRGTVIKVRHAELLYEDGTLNVENLRGARATDTYTLKGEGEEVFEPHFTYHGFRYVEVTGYPGTPAMDSVAGRVVHSDVKPIGGFSSSKELLNQIQHIVQWGITSNLESVPTDCNQRDERMGWMADAHLYSEAAMYNFDMAAFYTNWLRSIRDEQDADGGVPDTTPRARFAHGAADPSWGAAYPLILWYAYQQYGDRRLLEQHFDGIRKWSDFLWSKSTGGTTDFVKYGDWVPVDFTPGPLTSTVYSYAAADVAAKVAHVLGKSAEEQALRQRCAEIKDGFNKRFFNAAEGYFGNGSQGSQVLPLAYGLADDKNRGRAQGYLWNQIVYHNNSHLTTGILATKHLLPLLSRNGNLDLAYDIATKTDFPSWGYMIANGATTLWELWQKREGPSMNSHNHAMFGSIGGWFMTDLAGIQLVEGGEGYEKLVIRPGVTRELKWAAGNFETLRGKVLSSWRRSDDGLRLEVMVPFGSTARIFVPKLGLHDVSVSEGGKPLWQDKKSAGSVEGVTAVSENDDDVVVDAGSGDYTFHLKGL